MKMKFGLNQSQIDGICSIFSKYDDIKKVTLYGSRAKGNYKPYSDIDLTLQGDKLNLSLQFKVENELDDLLLPYKIDLSIYNYIQNPDLIEHIDKDGICIYQALDKKVEVK